MLSNRVCKSRSLVFEKPTSGTNGIYRGNFPTVFVLRCMHFVAEKNALEMHRFTKIGYGLKEKALKLW